ncbi:hypothetical protein BX666DRAFT_1859711 [Dichotomocladium elegans]|nr:hypothetical protein BX666DRAFT_1859711 [Dichotomocladium elegans]
MSSPAEKVYVIGGTGNSGRRVVADLLSSGVSVTVYTRNGDKARSLFGTTPGLQGSAAQLQVVEGDYENLTPFEKTIGGHTRLFACVTLDTGGVGASDIMVNLAKLAYQAGVKQVVAVSSISVSWQWRTTSIGHVHRVAEERIIALTEGQRGIGYVVLRPYRFMSNFLNFGKAAIMNAGVVTELADKDEPQSYISPDDIGALAAIILREPIEKHKNAVYEMVGDTKTGDEAAAILSKVLNKPVRYVQQSVEERYKTLTSYGMHHLVAYDLCSPMPSIPVTNRLSILLGRQPETLEHYLERNKQEFAEANR